MKPFKDSAGRLWDLSVTAAAAKRVLGALKLDILQPQSGDPPVYLALHRDPCLLSDVIYHIIKPDADKAGVTAEQFGEALNGESMGAAKTAFMEDWSDFFRGLGRLDLEALLKAQTDIMAEQVKQGTVEVDKELTFARATIKELAETRKNQQKAPQADAPGVGMTSGNSPES